MRKITQLLKQNFYFGLVVLFVSKAILVDLKIDFPADTNIPFPESLLFYPAIGFLVEILFHILPLSVLLFSLTSIFNNISYDKTLLVSILIVAMLEPTYQTIFMDSIPTWAMVIVWINLFLFNVTQLFIFRNTILFLCFLLGSYIMQFGTLFGGISVYNCCFN